MRDSNDEPSASNLAFANHPITGADPIAIRCHFDSSMDIILAFHEFRLLRTAVLGVVLRLCIASALGWANLRDVSGVATTVTFLLSNLGFDWAVLNQVALFSTLKALPRLDRNEWLYSRHFQ